ncbi:MAG: hypothetical protein VW934_13335, partial [Alphaproteobacteria bacterium]
MYRNLDMAALRSLVAIADTCGVTSAAAEYGSNALFQCHFTSHVFFAKSASPRLTLPDCLGNRHWTP